MSSGKTPITHPRTDLAVRIAVAAVLCALPALLFRDVLFGGESFFSRDVAPFFYPMKAFMAEAVRNGAVPLWNPWILNGEPFFATLQPGLLYPGSLLLYVLPMPAAFDLLTVVHYPLAGLGAYLLLRSWEHGRPAALLGGTAFMLGGYFASIGNFTNNLQTVAWIPWVLLAWDRFLRAGRARDALWFAAACAVAFLGGEPQMLALGLAVALAHGLLRVERDAVPASRQLLAFGAAGFLAVGLVAVQLLPFAELVRHSVRTLEPDLAYSAGHALDAGALVQLLVPPPLEGGPAGFTGRHLLRADGFPWLLSIYPGCVVAALAAVGLRVPRSRRWAAFWGVVAVVGLALALGRNTPVFPAAYEALPPLRLVRFPEKFYFLTALATGVLAAGGADRWLAGEARARAVAAAAAIAVAAAGLLAAARLGGLEAACASLFAGAPACGAPAASAAAWAAAALRVLLLAGALLGLAALLLRGRVSPELAGAAAVALVGADLVVAHRAVNASVDGDVYTRTPWAEEVLDERLPGHGYRYRASPLSAVMGQMAKVPGAWELSNLYLYLETGGPNLGQLHGRMLQDGLQGVELRSVAHALNFGIRNEGRVATNLLRAMNVAYYADATSLAPSLPGLRPAAAHPELPIRIWEVEDPVPRAYVVGRYETEADPVAALRSAIGPGFDLHGSVVLDGPPAGRVAADARGRVVEASWGMNRVRMTVEADAPALLVLTDRHFPGWVATVDGETVPIRVANGQFRAVRVPAGKHEVAFRFQPRSVAVGGGVSAAAGLLFLFGVLVTGRRGSGPEGGAAAAAGPRARGRADSGRDVDAGMGDDPGPAADAGLPADAGPEPGIGPRRAEPGPARPREAVPVGAAEADA